ncbi:hypothetical protein ABS71_13745 [bacterium SCN 62-11]|nr:MAG: hypothetical protein ABS71_13745 [bacterium SCN 62-11]
MLIPTQPGGGRDWKPARTEPRNQDQATMLADIQQANDHYVPNGPEPPEPPQKPGHHWLGGHLSLEGVEHWLHAKSDLVGLKADVVGLKADAVDVVDTALGHAAHTGMTATATVAASALGAASGALGLVLLNLGARDVKEGIEHRDWAHTVEGVGSLIVGTRSVAAGVATAGHLLPHTLLVTETGALAAKLVGPLGLVHGAIDAGLGVNDIVQGVKGENKGLITKGALGVGMGASLMAAAAGGGIPALASAGLFLAGKVYLDVKGVGAEPH